MTERAPADTANLDRYGNAALEWSRVRDALDRVPGPDATYFLRHLSAGRHAALRGHRRAVAGRRHLLRQRPGSPQGRDLAVNPSCTISVRRPGIDLVLDGTAARTTEPEALERVAAGYRAGGWPARVEGDAFTAPFCAPSAGPPPWHVYQFTFRTVVGVATAEPYGATRWRF